MVPYRNAWVPGYACWHIIKEGAAFFSSNKIFNPPEAFAGSWLSLELDNNTKKKHREKEKHARLVKIYFDKCVSPCMCMSAGAKKDDV